MAFFTPIASNSHRYIWEEDDNNLQTDKNMLYEDYEYPNKYFSNIRQVIIQGSDDWVQFRTDYINIVSELYNCDGLVTTLTNTPITTDAVGFTYYQVDIDTSLLDGYYYIRHSMETDYDKPIVHYRTDWYQIKTELTDSVLLEWSGSLANDIPMQWGAKTQELRLVAHMADYAAGMNLTTLESSNNNLVNIVADPLNNRFLSIDNINEYMAEKINIAFSHDYFYVNGQRFGTNEPIEIGERQGDTLTYTFKIPLREWDYLNYATDRELTGTLPAVPTKAIRFSPGKAIRFETGKAVRYS